jgi:hypothetical protein
MATGVALPPTAVATNAPPYHRMEVSAMECCAEPGGAGRCCWVMWDFVLGVGCTGGELGVLSGDGYWLCCCAQGPVTWVLPWILRPILFCLMSPKLFAVLGEADEGLCLNCLCAFFCTPCRTCQFLNEFDRRRLKGVGVQPGRPFHVVSRTSVPMP